MLKSTDWWYGYQTSVKQAVKLECQGFDGELDVICVKGGFITQLEAAEMGRIMSEATNDCLKSGITVKYKISEVSYYEFLSTYGPALTCADATVGVVDTSRHGNPEPEPEIEPAQEPRMVLISSERLVLLETRLAESEARADQQAARADQLQRELDRLQRERDAARRQLRANEELERMKV